MKERAHMDTMKAYVYESANHAVLKDVPIPQFSDSEVLIRVKACGICHTDLMVLTGVNIVPVPFPFIGGHEWSGEIAGVGKDVKSFRVGDRVVGEGNSGCGVCRVCREGIQDYCTLAPVQRGINCDGAMAGYYRIKPELLHRFPDFMDWKTASMIEPFTVAYNGINGMGGCDAGDTVVVQGGGSIGLSAVAAAKAMGARVVVLEPQAYRRGIAKELKADYVFDPAGEDAVGAVKELTAGYGADLVIEASGNAASIGQSLRLVRNMGRIAYLGVNVDGDISVEFGKIQMGGIRVQGFLGSPRIWGKAIAFLSQSKLDLSPLSTHTFPLDRVDEAFAFARDIKNNELVKVTIVMD
jgi:L-iditol 2-dehydrogenase